MPELGCSPISSDKAGGPAPPRPPPLLARCHPMGFHTETQLLVSAGLEKHQELFGGCESEQNSAALHTSPALRPPTVLCDPHSHNLNPSGPPIPTTPVLQDPHSHNPNPSGPPFLHPHSPRTPPPPLGPPLLPPIAPAEYPSSTNPPPPPPLRASLHPQHCREGGQLLSAPPGAYLQLPGAAVC